MSGPELAARGVAAHPTGRTRFFSGPTPEPVPEAPCPGQRIREAANRRRQASDFLKRNRTKSRKATRETFACSCTPARPPSARLPARPSPPPAFHFAFRVVWCRGQSHGRGGSRIAVSSRARGSGTAPCRSSRPSMSPVLALSSSPWWRSLCFVCRSLSEASKISNAG